MEDLLNQVLGSIVYAFLLTWWFLVPLILLIVLKERWILYVRSLFLKNLEWVVLEIKVPRELLKTPKAMEGVFAGLFATHSYGIKFWDTWWEGKVERWTSFEIVGLNGGVYFYIRTPRDFKNLIESSLYSQFPDIEISEAADYLAHLPPELPNVTYDLWGAEIELARDSAYPIKTYAEFEDAVEERRIDPVASIVEAMSGLKKEEEVMLMQILVSPVSKATNYDGQEKAKEVVDEIMGKKPKAKKGNFFEDVMSGMSEFLGNLFTAFWQQPTWKGVGENKEEKGEVSFMHISEGNKNVVKAVERKAGQLLFETTIRVIYIDRQDSFTPLNVTAIMGFFHQFNTYNMNGFKPNVETMTIYGKLIGRIFPFFKKYKLTQKKKFIYNRYRNRTLGQLGRLGKEKLPVLSAEELATIFHFPIVSVEAPSLARLPSKKSEPPTDLPIK